MDRNGNTMGLGPRRQNNQDEAQPGDRQQRQERLAEKELREADVAIGRSDQADGAEGAATAGEAPTGEASTGEPAAPPEAASQADGTPYGGTEVGASEGVKPATHDRLEAADVDPDAERKASRQDERA